MAPAKSRSADDERLWKNHLNQKAISAMAAEIARSYRRFDGKSFVTAVMSDDFEGRELKDRIQTIARHLSRYLPADYSKAVDVLIKTAPRVGMFENWALTSYVELFGLEHFDDSVRALRALTPHSSSEFAIRPFMIRYTKRMMPILMMWATDRDEHVRRLAAEGSRPRGVWTAHIEDFKEDPSPVLKLLELLKADPSLYVRKAVANNLNDISKEHPKLVIDTALRWQKDDHPYTNWIIKHACRSLIKTGHPEVFPVFGFAYPPRVEVKNLRLSPRKLEVGEDLSFSFDLESSAGKSQKLAIDYAVTYVRAGGRSSRKVFKLSEKELPSGQKLSLSARRSFADVSTRTHHPGRHQLDIIVNGEIISQRTFSVTR
jgi:3-methyladenine DNA glycosylase AlkC